MWKSPRSFHNKKFKKNQLASKLQTFVEKVVVSLKTKIKRYGFSQAFGTFHFVCFFVGFGRRGFSWPKRKAWFKVISAT